MTREEEIKAAIVVTPDAIAFVSPEMNHASEHLGLQLCFFVDFVQALEPKLQRFEATQLAAAFLENLPEMCQGNPEVIECLKQNAQLLIERRFSKS
ncbi:MAG: hypothetical protein V7K14_30605 [Nostoc sp.]|uniref:hypothetical protein n=1 Tax=Nostoc sp. TaxID=1180 RepID=UPI002FFC79A9